MPIPYTPPYSATGPWTNGAAPGISASALNEIEGWIAALDGPTASTITGSGGGTATLYQPLTGTFKLVVVTLSSFKNSGGSAQTLAIPTPFTTFVHGWNTNLNPFQVLKASSAQTVQQIVTLNTGADNTVSAQTTLHANWLWHADVGLDTISFNGSQSSTVSGHMILFGI